MSTNSLSNATHTLMVWRLRLANARYCQIAREMRCKSRLTHHAKSYARFVGLYIDIFKAKNCPKSSISMKPLPIIDDSVSPSIMARPLTGSLKHSTERVPRESVVRSMPLSAANRGPCVRMEYKNDQFSPQTCIRLDRLLSPLVLSPFSKGWLPQQGSGSNLVEQEACHSLPNIQIPLLPRLSLDPKQDDHFHYIPVPGAPLLRPRELPDIENDSISSSDSSLRIGATIRLPAKRKLDAMDGWDHSFENSSLRMHKYTLKKQWARSQQNTRIARGHYLRSINRFTRTINI